MDRYLGMWVDRHWYLISSLTLAWHVHLHESKVSKMIGEVNNLDLRNGIRTNLHVPTTLNLYKELPVPLIL